MKKALASLVFMFLASVPCGAAEQVRPPAQPEKGPGGKEYGHSAVTCVAHGAAESQYWIFEPAEPKPERAPVVFFLHGWTAMEPAIYGGWIRHVVRRGAVVLYPRYQGTIFTPPAKMLESAIGALKEAMAKLKEPGHVQPDLDKVAVVGHSLGGAMCVNVAVLAKSEGLPQPKVVISVQPAAAWILGGPRFQGSDDPAKIPAGTLALVVVGEDDTIVGTEPGRRVYERATSVAKADRNLVIMRTDTHGTPALNADHFSPVAFDMSVTRGKGGALGAQRAAVSSPGDALDFFGYWKFLDGLCDAAFNGKNREYALGNTPQQKLMGTWSDGTPVKEPEAVCPP